jgi:peptide chain release factor 2
LLKKDTERSDFWNSEDAGKISKELAELEEEIDFFASANNEIAEVQDFVKVLYQENDLNSELEKELEDRLDALEQKLKSKETAFCFRGKYDKGNAILSIYSGAGGQDAQDWAAMLLRMYNRYADKKDFKVTVIDEAFGEEGGGEAGVGLKSATIEIKGKYAYGLLKNETGVHRLVRISPFSSQKLRHTSFVLVEVLPDLADNEEVEIKPEEVRLDFYKSSGPGGQYVNKRESAVRVTHLPTGIVVTCQSERLQGKNKDKAMAILAAKLYQYEEDVKKKELQGIKGERISASWGNQIRSYVLHPYKLVKDLRTDVESTNPDSVLDGDLDAFIEEEIKIK